MDMAYKKALLLGGASLYVVWLLKTDKGAPARPRNRLFSLNYSRR